MIKDRAQRISHMAMSFVVGLLCLWSFALIAQQADISVEAYGKLPERSLLTISPDASRMAYRDTKDGRDVIIVIDLVQNKVIAAADASAVSPTSLYFIDNDRLILRTVSNNRLRGYRGTHEISAAYSFSLSTKKIIQLLVPGKGKPLPAIILAHGGPESYDRVDFDFLVQYFSSEGYGVIQPQFRGSSGFGSEHLLLGRGQWGKRWKMI